LLKRLNRSRCYLECELVDAQGTMHQAGMDTHGNGHFEGHAWTCPDFSAVDILNPIRLGTAAMRPWLSVYCSNSLAWRRQGHATGDVNADTDDTDHRLI